MQAATKDPHSIPALSKKHFVKIWLNILVHKFCFELLWSSQTQTKIKKAIPDTELLQKIMTLSSGKSQDCLL